MAATAGHVDTLLSALSYPEPVPDLSSFNAGYRALVLWLENQKIRQLAQEDRAGLANVQSHSWAQAFSQYADELGSPIEASESESRLQMSWLLQLAVSLAYQDQGLHEGGEQQRQDHQHAADCLAEVSDQSTSQLIQDISKSLQLPASTNSLQALQALVERIQTLQTGNDSTCEFSMDDVPLGFTTQGWPNSMLVDGQDIDRGLSADADVDRAASVLRLLYLKQMRLLQTAIDDAIVSVQEFTANPRTNTR